MESVENARFDWVEALRLGLLGGAVGIYLCLVGLVEAFAERDIIEATITFGQTLLSVTLLGIGYVAARRCASRGSRSRGLLYALSGAALAGLLTSALLVILVIIAEAIDMRAVFINVSPELLDLLKFEQATGPGILLMLISGVVIGVIGGVISRLPSWLRNALLISLSIVVVFGLLRDILRVVLTGQAFLVPISDFLFASEGLTKEGAFGLFAVVFVLSAIWSSRSRSVGQRVQQLPAPQKRAIRWASIALGVLILLILPGLLRSYLTNVTDKVGLFVMMGLGLNIVVGFAGLLDLGYVAFYAIGAYVMAVLTTSSPTLGGAELSFWTAFPISVAASVLAGIILGVPVLNMRGDYLAIVTLGFGEIIRLLALSNWLAPYVGGAQGIIPIPRPTLPTLDLGPATIGGEFATFQNLYYLILIGCAIAFFISWRLRDSRLGRAWMAMREDEDVAEAMGINLVATKLMAFATGAAFAGSAGAIFASQVSSIFPHSFDLLVSINVLSLIIVGGIGSLPGVVVGSLFLVGLPEVLSELQEFRLLFYGAALVLVMLVRPEGLWPEATRQRELHAGQVEEETVTVEPAVGQRASAD